MQRAAPGSLPTRGWTIAEWRRAYVDEGRSPRELLSALLAALDDSDPAWISVADAPRLERQLDELDSLLERAGGDRTRLPLYGVPFAEIGRASCRERGEGSGGGVSRKKQNSERETRRDS